MERKTVALTIIAVFLCTSYFTVNGIAISVIAPTQVFAQELTFENPLPSEADTEILIESNEPDESDAESAPEAYQAGVSEDFSQLSPSRIINPQVAPEVIQAYPTQTDYFGSNSNSVVFAIPTRRMVNSGSNILLVQGVGSAGTDASVQPFNSAGTGTAAGSATAAAPTTSSWWDPFGFTNKGPLFGSSTGSNHLGTFPETEKVMRRFIERVSLDYTYIPRGSEDKGFGYNDLGYKTEFTFPCKLMGNEPIYLNPGINLFWWDGPTGPPKHRYNVSPNGFGAYLESYFAPRINENLAFSFWGSAGVYSDYNKIVSKSFRLKGKAEVLIGLTDKMEGVFGVNYINRARVKILPQIGVIWRPNKDDKDIWRLVFPDPKITHYLTRLNNTDWSCYLQGNYGGGVWTITDKNYETAGGGEVTLLMDYNDIRIGGGFEFSHKGWLNGYFELGGVFGRELYTNGRDWFKPSEAVYVKAGFYF